MKRGNRPQYRPSLGRLCRQCRTYQATPGSDYCRSCGEQRAVWDKVQQLRAQWDAEHGAGEETEA